MSRCVAKTTYLENAERLTIWNRGKMDGVFQFLNIVSMFTILNLKSKILEINAFIHLILLVT